MSDCVVDASALALAVGGKTASASALRTRLTGVRRHAPHLIDAEVGNVLRRHERNGLLSATEAGHGLRSATVLIDHRYPHHGPLGQLAWSLRHNLTFSDALYVALAATLNLPLVTADVRLSGVPALPCTVELV